MPAIKMLVGSLFAIISFPSPVLNDVVWANSKSCCANKIYVLPTCLLLDISSRRTAVTAGHGSVLSIRGSRAIVVSIYRRIVGVARNCYVVSFDILNDFSTAA